MNLFCWKLNATCIYSPIGQEISNPLAYLMTRFLTNKVDFSTNQILYLITMNNTGIFSWTYPNTLHQVCAVVRKRDKYSNISNLMMTFDGPTWLLILTGFLIILLVFFVFQERRVNLGVASTFFIVLQLHVLGASGTPIRRVFARNYSIPLLISMYCFLIIIFFGSQLTSLMMLPRYYKNIDTLEDFYAESPDVFVHQFLTFHLVYDLQKINRKKARINSLLKPVSIELRDIPVNGSLVDVDSKLSDFLAAHPTGNYHVVKECFCSLPSANCFQYFSPLIRKYNDLKLRVNEAGIDQHWIEMDRLAERNFSSVSENVDVEIFRFLDLRHVFLLLLWGWSTAGVVLVVEIVISRIFKRNLFL